MESVRSKLASVVLWTLVTGLLSQNLAFPVKSASTHKDQKNYYSPDPRAGSPPRGSGGSPPRGTTPSHGGGSHGGTPPSHGRPSHGGGSYNPAPSTPGNCGNPPPRHDPTPSAPSTPSTPPSGGGGHYNPPSSGGSTPPAPVDQSPPTTPIYQSPPTTPIYQSPPTTPIYQSPPTTPVYQSPPTTPIIDPGTPSTPTIPTPPFDPNSPFIGTCNFWRTHPAVIWGLLGWWGTLGNAFGVTSVPSSGENLNLIDALSNKRTDGFGALYREGTASFLNSMVNNKFPFTTKQVRDHFVAAVGTNKAAATQARVFKLANEGRLKPRT